MNNLEKYQQRVADLEGEVVGYRMVLEAIKLVAVPGKPMPPGPLYNLVCKTLQEKDGSELQAEFTFLRLLESGLRHENQLAAKRPDATQDPEGFRMWADSMQEIGKGQLELLTKLDELRLAVRQREASRLIIPH